MLSQKFLTLEPGWYDARSVFSDIPMVAVVVVAMLDIDFGV